MEDTFADDAFVISRPEPRRRVLQDDPLVLDRAFNARSIAVVGASANPTKWANILFRRLIEGPFYGQVAAVNPAHTEIEDMPCYATIPDVPHDLDYVQILVPRADVPGVVRDCVARRVPVVHVLSAGFGEVGGEGSALQRQLVNELDGSGTALVGPNSLGIYSARTGLDFSKGCHFDPGSITFISQSGGLCTDILALGQARGLKFGKVLSVGNCCDLDWPDYVRYCRHDDETGIAVFYIESVRDGRALFDELRELAKVKPVLLLKGGRTEEGAKSVVSHTGRLAGSYETWRAMMRQAGVMELAGIDDLLVTLDACDHVTSRQDTPDGEGIMVVGSGGGVSVLTADSAHGMGLTLARLEPRTLDTLKLIIPDADDLGGVGNPVEIPVDRMFGKLDTMACLIECACGDAAVGSLLLHINLIALANNYNDGGEDAWPVLCERLYQASTLMRQPLVIVLRNGDCDGITEKLFDAGMKRLRIEFGLPVFADIADALNFISRVKTLRSTRP